MSSTITHCHYSVRVTTAHPRQTQASESEDGSVIGGLDEDVVAISRDAISTRPRGQLPEVRFSALFITMILTIAWIARGRGIRRAGAGAAAAIDTQAFARQAHA